MSAYYTSLPGHLSEFESGCPILMYHKLGKPPAGTKMKGLYVTPVLFLRQLSEWLDVGGGWGNLSEIRSPFRLTITFDDGFSNTLRLGLEPLRKTKCQAIQFIVPGLIGKYNSWDLPSGEVQESLMDREQIKEWLAAGHQIGAHTMSHPYLTRIPVSQAREEIAASKKTLEDLFGIAIQHFAYPYGDSNGAVRDLVEEAGFATACLTEAGVNGPQDDLFRLKRFMARHPSRKLFKPSTWFRK